MRAYLHYTYGESLESHLNPLHPNISLEVLHSPLYTYMEKLPRNQDLLGLAIITLNLMTLGVTLLGEIRCLSLSGVKG